MGEPVTVDEIALILSEGLDLCVRARKLDDAISAAMVAGHVGEERGTEIRCLTPALWVPEAYDRDLDAWESRAKTVLARLPMFRPLVSLSPHRQGGEG